jgi:hypothetical protein
VQGYSSNANLSAAWRRVASKTVSRPNCSIIKQDVYLLRSFTALKFLASVPLFTVRLWNDV